MTTTEGQFVDIQRDLADDARSFHLYHVNELRGSKKGKKAFDHIEKRANEIWPRVKAAYLPSTDEKAAQVDSAEKPSDIVDLTESKSDIAEGAGYDSSDSLANANNIGNDETFCDLTDGIYEALELTGLTEHIKIESDDENTGTAEHRNIPQPRLVKPCSEIDYRLSLPDPDDAEYPHQRRTRRYARRASTRYGINLLSKYKPKKLADYNQYDFPHAYKHATPEEVRTALEVESETGAWLDDISVEHSFDRTEDGWDLTRRTTLLAENRHARRLSENRDAIARSLHRQNYQFLRNIVSTDNITHCSCDTVWEHVYEIHRCSSFLDGFPTCGVARKGSFSVNSTYAGEQTVSKIETEVKFVKVRVTSR